MLRNISIAGLISISPTGCFSHENAEAALAAPRHNSCVVKNEGGFYRHVRAELFGGRLSSRQFEGLSAIVKEAHRRGVCDKRVVAYILATAYHETARTMQPIHEYGNRRYFNRYDIRYRPRLARRLGNLHAGDGYLFRGRGYVQITGRRNFRVMGDRFDVDLVGNPDLALEPNLAAAILFEGMQQGIFTGHAIGRYINTQRTDFVGARRVINGTDQKETIARYARIFMAALQAR